MESKFRGGCGTDSPARSTCAAAPSLRSSPLGADMVGKSRNMSADMLFTPGLLALMPPTICCVRSQSVRDLVTEISGGATPHRCGVAQSSSSELATQAWPSQPHSRLVVPVHVGSRLAHSGSPTHPSLHRLSTVPCIILLYSYHGSLSTLATTAASPSAPEARGLPWAAWA